MIIYSYTHYEGARIKFSYLSNRESTLRRARSESIRPGGMHRSVVMKHETIDLSPKRLMVAALNGKALEFVETVAVFENGRKC